MQILLIEDDPGDALLAARSLQQAFANPDIVVCSTVSEAKNRVNDIPFDVIVSDLNLPDAKNVQAVAALASLVPECPIVVLTNSEDTSMGSRALHEGAQDYIHKAKLDALTLEKAIRFAIDRHEVTQENRRLLKENQVFTDLLQSKNKRLEQLCDTAQRFVDDVSHDFRTPLTVIREYASILQDELCGPVTEDQAKMLSVIDDRIWDLNTMVDDLLDSSRLNSGLTYMHRQQCQLSEVFLHVSSMLEQKSRLKGISLNIEMPDGISVYCDPEKIGRILVNLGVNAIKFSPEQTGQVAISASYCDDGNAVLVRVSDNGVGIPQDSIEKIFERFNQGDAAFQSSCKGFGLGLSIASRLVSLNFGEMRVESKPEKGSTFSFTIPLFVPALIVRGHLNRLRELEDYSDMTVFSIQAMDQMSDEGRLDETTDVLTSLTRINDLLLQVESGRWLLFLAMNETDKEIFIDRFMKDYRDHQSKMALPTVEVERLMTGQIDEIDEEVIQLTEENSFASA